MTEICASCGKDTVRLVTGPRLIQWSSLERSGYQVAVPMTDTGWHCDHCGEDYYDYKQMQEHERQIAAHLREVAANLIRWADKVTCENTPPQA